MYTLRYYAKTVLIFYGCDETAPGNIAMKAPGLWAVSALSFIAGATVYWLFRSTEMVMFGALRRVSEPLFGRLTHIRALLADFTLPHWVAYNLPDGMWLLSLLCTVHAIWLGHSAVCRILAWSLTICAIASEALQYTGLLPGTADWLDVAAYTGASVIYMTLTNQITIPICKQKLSLRQS